MIDQIPTSNLWRLLPHTFAKKASGGRWLPYVHLKIISRILASAIAQGGGRLVFDAPPRHGKSLLISQWTPIWYLDRDPSKFVGVASYEAELAETFGRTVRNEMEYNELVRTNLRQDSKAAKRFNTPEGGGMWTAGVGGPATGKGFHLGLIDDPIKNWEDAESARKREKLIDWFNSTFYTRAEPGATIAVLATRWNENDLSGYLLNEHADDWTHVHMPALAEEDDILGRAYGDPLCPERYAQDALKRIQAGVGSRIWNALYQGRPAPVEGELWKRSYWRFWKELPHELDVDETIQSWDLRFGDKKDRGSWVVGQVWKKKGARKYLVDQVRGRWSFTESITQFLRLTAKHPEARKKLVENKANGSALESTLKKKVPGIKLVEPQGGKISRATSCEPTLDAGDVFLPDDRKAHPWVDDFIEEAAVFPNGKNDDQVDTASQAINYFEGKGTDWLESLIAL